MMKHPSAIQAIENSAEAVALLREAHDLEWGHLPGNVCQPETLYYRVHEFLSRIGALPEDGTR